MLLAISDMTTAVSEQGAGLASQSTRRTVWGRDTRWCVVIDDHMILKHLQTSTLSGDTCGKKTSFGWLR